MPRIILPIATTAHHDGHGRIAVELSDRRLPTRMRLTRIGGTLRSLRSRGRRVRHAVDTRRVVPGSFQES